MTGNHMATCSAPGCRLRFPVTTERQVDTCPMCGGDLAHDDPHGPFESAPSMAATTTVAGMLDNVRSVANVGAMLRTADATGLAHVDLVGITAPGDHPDIDKTALGAQHAVRWAHHRHGPERVAHLAADGWQVWALEATPRCRPLSRAVDDLAVATPRPRIVLVVGHEVAGVDPSLLVAADRHVSIPMRGTKASLNVATAFGIAAWALTSA